MRRKNKYGPRKKIFFLSFSFRLALIVFSIAICISYFSRFINPATLWSPSFFGIYFIPIATANLLLLIIALVRRSRSALIPFLSLLPTILFIQYFVQLGENHSAPFKEKGVKILTYNVGQFSSSKTDSTKRGCQKQIVEFIKKEKPAIICFQEYYTSDTLTIKSLFPEYKYRKYYFFKLKDKTFFGNLTLSKFPITSGGNISFRGSTNLSLYSDIDINDSTYRIYNNHLESYNISITSLVKKIGDKTNILTEEIIEVHGKMIGTNLKRSKQVDIILEDIENCEHNVIVCGDFNDTPMSFTYYRMAYGRKDSFLDAGTGFGATLTTFWPMLRIDYILVPKSMNVEKHITHRVPYSDHYPVSAILHPKT